MAKTAAEYFENLRESRVWRSIFRSGTGTSTLHRSLAIQQNIFLHLFSTKVRTRMLSFSATWYLGTLTLGTFLILVATGIPLMLYYHPSAPQAYADTKDLQFVEVLVYGFRHFKPSRRNPAPVAEHRWSDRPADRRHR